MGQRLAETLGKCADVTFRPEEADRTLELLQLVQEFMQAINPKFTQMTQRVSELDKMVDQVLHDIEVENFDMYQAFVTLRRLQALRQERRKVKALIEVWREVKHNFGRTDVQEAALARAVGRLDDFYNYMGMSPARAVEAGDAAD